MGYRHISKVSAPNMEVKQAYKARQMLAPRASVPPLVEVAQKKDETNKRSNQSAGAQNPPRPPQRLAPLEEANRLLGELA